ncbi:MAG: BlaI family penicillinase repressor [Planctomycetota bacterium]|jgi:BlaI family penicillinase repressor
MNSKDAESPLSGLQLAVMRVLWDRGEARVTEVHAGLQQERSIAATTVATLLKRLEKRGLVTHHSEGRQFVYRALRSHHDVSRTMLGDLTNNLFRGDTSELVAHFLSQDEIAPGDLSLIKRMIEDKERESKA